MVDSSTGGGGGDEGTPPPPPFRPQAPPPPPDVGNEMLGDDPASPMITREDVRGVFGGILESLRGGDLVGDLG